MASNKLTREKATDYLLDILTFKVTFLNKPPGSVLCLICVSLLKRPLQTSCGHRVCAKCFDDLQVNRDGKRICPSDNEVIEYQFPDISALTEIMNLQCFCVHEKEGCKWIGILLNLEDHLRICDFNHQAPCRWAFVCCEFTGTKKAVEAHMSKEHVKHHALFTNLLSTVLSQFRSTKTSMNELRMLTDSLLRKTSDSDSCVASRSILNDCIDFLRERRFDSTELKIWFDSVCDTLDEIESSASFTPPELAELLEKISRQQNKIYELIQRKPGRGDLLDLSKKVTDKLTLLEKSSKQHHSQLAEVDLKIRLFQSATFDGFYIWKVDNLKNRMLSTSNGTLKDLFSPPLFSECFGYKFCAKVLLYGDTSKNQPGSSVEHIALYLVLMKGDYDEILDYPFPYKVSFKLRNLSKKNDIVETIVPDHDKPNFGRPYDDMNPAIGFSKFCSHDTLYSDGFVKDDAIFIEIKVDKSRNVFK